MILALQRSCSLRMQSVLLGVCADLTLSKQALHKRLNAGACGFLQQCLASAIAWRTPSAGHLKGIGFKRVLVHDSTCLSLPATLAAFFPGPANQSGKPQASLRIQCLYDLCAERFVAFLLCPFTRNDQAAASDPIGLLRAGDILLRDLGYFTLASLRAIAAKGAFFLTRCHCGSSLLDPLSGLPIDLTRILRRDQVLDIPVLAGQREKLPLRLLALPLPDALGNQRRRKARANRDKRLHHSEAYLHLLGWNLLLTNASPAQLSATKAARLYGLRWRIEILFKSWKSHLGLRCPNRIGRYQAQVLVYGLLLFAVLTHHCLPQLADTLALPSSQSFLKTTQLLAQWILPSLLATGIDLPRRLMDQLSFHCLYDKRRRSNYYALKVSCLS